MQEQLTFDNIRVKHNQPMEWLSIVTPVDVVTITNSSFQKNHIDFYGNEAMPDYLKTRVNMIGCVFTHEGPMNVICNSVNDKEILLKTASSMELHDDFSASVVPGNGSIEVASDLTGLKEV